MYTPRLKSRNKLSPSTWPLNNGMTLLSLFNWCFAWPPCLLCVNQKVPTTIVPLKIFNDTKCTVYRKRQCHSNVRSPRLRGKLTMHWSELGPVTLRQYNVSRKSTTGTEGETATKRPWWYESKLKCKNAETETGFSTFFQVTLISWTIQSYGCSVSCFLHHRSPAEIHIRYIYSELSPVCMVIMAVKVIYNYCGTVLELDMNHFQSCTVI